MPACRHVHFEGRVQGVGFRYSAKQIAMGFEVTGWVRNLADGRVEMLAAGDEEEVDAFLQEIADSHLGGLIRETTVEDVPPPADLRGFEIRG